MMGSIVNETQCIEIREFPDQTHAKLSHIAKPWMVSVGGCGGTLIGARVVLTALHCIGSSVYVGQVVKVGVHNKRIWEHEEQRRRIQKLVSYLRNGVTNSEQLWRKVDILILILDKKVKITKDVQIAKLPRPGLKCPQNLQVCGWGDDYYNQTRNTETLWCVRQTCRPKSECDASSMDQLRKFKLCATYPARFPYNWLNSACKGDSGGPLFYTDKNGMATVIGVVSEKGTKFGKGSLCNAPTIYASVGQPRILKWIKKTMSHYN